MLKVKNASFCPWKEGREMLKADPFSRAQFILKEKIKVTFLTAEVLFCRTNTFDCSTDPIAVKSTILDVDIGLVFETIATVGILLLLNPFVADIIPADKGMEILMSVFSVMLEATLSIIDAGWLMTTKEPSLFTCCIDLAESPVTVNKLLDNSFARISLPGGIKKSLSVTCIKSPTARGSFSVRVNKIETNELGALGVIAIFASEY